MAIVAGDLKMPIYSTIVIRHNTPYTIQNSTCKSCAAAPWANPNRDDGGIRMKSSGQNIMKKPSSSISVVNVMAVARPSFIPSRCMNTIDNALPPTEVGVMAEVNSQSIVTLADDFHDSLRSERR